MGMIGSFDTPQRPARRRWLARMASCALVWPALAAMAAQPALPGELKAPIKPTSMPAFVLPTTSGKTLDSTSLKGQVLLIRFWASW